VSRRKQLTFRLYVEIFLAVNASAQTDPLSHKLPYRRSATKTCSGVGNFEHTVGALVLDASSVGASLPSVLADGM